MADASYWRQHFARSGAVLTLMTCLASGPASATVAVYSGALDDPSNTALVGPDAAPSPASFVDDYAIANNTALYAFSVAYAGSVTFQSTSFATGGVDPYFTLLDGTGPTATFDTSNYDQAFSTGGDFTISVSLAVGAYTFAIGDFANMSFAENYGSGTLGDGFIALGQPDSLGNDRYRVVVTTPDATQPPPPPNPVPEPPSWMLVAAGVSVLAVATGRPRRRHAIAADYRRQ